MRTNLTLNRSALPLALAMLALNGCRAVGGIFKAGVWVGIVAAVIAIALVAGILTLTGRREPG